MIDIGIPKKYILVVDEQVRAMAKADVIKYGIAHVVTSALVRLDCSRVLDGMRMMQTIGTPYTYELGRLCAALEYAHSEGLIDDNQLESYVAYIRKRHKDNIKYEKDNPPIVYDKKTKVKNSRKSRAKAKEGTLEGFEKPKKVSAKQINAEARSKFLKGLKINIQ